MKKKKPQLAVLRKPLGKYQNIEHIYNTRKRYSCQMIYSLSNKVINIHSRKFHHLKKEKKRHIVCHWDTVAVLSDHW